jgi:hypothetical protein
VPIREGVSQISPPIRIVLVCAVAFMAAYMLFLRPKDETVEPPAPVPNVQTGEPAVSQPGKIAESAQEAVEAANGQLEAQESVDGVDAGEAAAGTAAGTAKGETGATGAAAIPADLKGVPKPAAKAIAEQKVLVLLFWNDKSADDRAVKKALNEVDRWDGRVYLHAAPLKSISKYGRITRGADVEQSPTIVVVDPALRADTVVGYVDTQTIDQMVVDAFRNSTGLFTDKYLARVNETCGQSSVAFNAIQYTPSNPQDYAASLSARERVWTRFQADFNAIDAPKKWRAFKRASVRGNAAIGAVLADWSAYLGSKPSRARVASGVDRFGDRMKAANRSHNRRMDRERLTSCGSEF